MPTTYERLHSNRITTWVREWPSGCDYGVRNSSRSSDVRHSDSIEKAQDAADKLAHPTCDGDCGHWLELPQR